MADDAPTDRLTEDGVREADGASGEGPAGRLNPAALPVSYAAQVLTRVSGQRITEEMIETDLDVGAPQNADGTINLVHYAAWLVQKMAIAGGSRGD